jgi:CheY-like chemotaxis protein
MLKILVVDDSEKRIKLLQQAFASSSLIGHISVVYVESADQARVEMLEPFDLLILDVVIPKKIGGTPHALHSSRLVDDLCIDKNDYIRPKMVIGLTADISELGSYRENFYKIASVVLPAKLHDKDWLASIIGHVSTLVRANQKIGQIRHDKLLLTIHGIRTHGKWQSVLNDEIRKYSRSYIPIEVKYGFFDLISFAIPWLRSRKTRQVASEVKNIILSNTDKEISVVAHSFGSLVLLEALRNIDLPRKIKHVILCGSPLPHDFDLSHLMKNSEITVNECGTRDFILVAAKSLVLGLGEAGRIGFRKSNSDQFMNRYFKGGHSLYFDASQNKQSFAETYWLPIILSESHAAQIDQRRNFLGEDLLDISIKLLAITKPFLYLALLAWSISLLF